MIRPVTFSILVATSGRPTLGYAVSSVACQLHSGDEILVLRDDSGDWGDSGRNALMSRARGTHILFLDDDDEFVPGSLDVARRFAAEYPGRVGIFRRSLAPVYEDEWRVPDLLEACTGMYCVPNIPEKLGHFRAPADEPRGRMGDVAFIRETLDLHAAEPIWIEDLLIVVRPEKSRWRRLRLRARIKQRLLTLLGIRRPRYPNTLPNQEQRVAAARAAGLVRRFQD